MARVKNVSDDPVDIPSLGLFAVQPGEIVDVPNADDFKGSELWQVTTSKKSDEENPK